MRLRPGKKDDQLQVQKAIVLIDELVKLNPGIEPNLWVSAFMSLTANTYMQNESTFSDYFNDMSAMVAHFKRIWENDN
jgi:hypothetical protein